MSKLNMRRKSCRDVFNSFLVRFARYSGMYEFPRLKGTHYVPKSVVAFSKALSCKNYNQWVHFYEDDYQFERIWKNPDRYLSVLSKYQGVILPDFSLFRDMPLVMQLWNIYRSRAIGHWLQNRGINIIPNIRFGDTRTYRISCDGIERNCTIAVGTHGTMKNLEDKKIFLEGLEVIVNVLKPNTIVVYGTLPESYVEKYNDSGINIVRFESEFSISHKVVS